MEKGEEGGAEVAEEGGDECDEQEWDGVGRHVVELAL